MQGLIKHRLVFLKFGLQNFFFHNVIGNNNHYWAIMQCVHVSLSIRNSRTYFQNLDFTNQGDENIYASSLHVSWSFVTELTGCGGQDVGNGYS